MDKKKKGTLVFCPLRVPNGTSAASLAYPLSFLGWCEAADALCVKAPTQRSHPSFHPRLAVVGVNPKGSRGTGTGWSPTACPRHSCRAMLGTGPAARYRSVPWRFRKPAGLSNSHPGPNCFLFEELPQCKGATERQ